MGTKGSHMKKCGKMAMGARLVDVFVMDVCAGDGVDREALRANFTY